MAALVGYGIVAMAALGYGGTWLWRAVTVATATITIERQRNILTW